jgi:hypothetical protein
MSRFLPLSLLIPQFSGCFPSAPLLSSSHLPFFKMINPFYAYFWPSLGQHLGGHIGYLKFPLISTHCFYFQLPHKASL